MSRLRQEPRAVRSLGELFAIAYAMEEEAATRYADLAVRLRSDQNPDLAEVFERLARDERGHLENVVNWSEEEHGQPPDPAHIRWKIPETFDDEGVGISDPRLVNTYRALAMAVRNEERAFAFWAYVAAHAEKADIAHAAEALAREELDHVATLRRERRKAYRAQGTRGYSLADGIALEELLANLLGSASRSASETEAPLLRRFADEAVENVGMLTRLPAGRLGEARAIEQWRDPVAISELLVDLYLEAAGSLRGEAAIADAQLLTGRAINRLAWLRADLPEIEFGTPVHD